MPRSWATFSADSLPVIALRINDVIVRALVDTGASQSLIDPRLARQLNFQADGSGWIVGVGTKPLQVSFVLIESEAIGRNLLKGFQSGGFRPDESTYWCPANSRYQCVSGLSPAIRFRERAALSVALAQADAPLNGYLGECSQPAMQTSCESQ